MYRQLNRDTSLRMTIADLTGGINPYIWRIEYCSLCRSVLKKYGDVTADELTHLGLHNDQRDA